LSLVLILRKKSKSLNFLSFYLFFCLVSDLILNKLSLKYFNSEIYSYRIFTIVEFCSIIFYSYYTTQNNLIKKLILGAFLLFFCSQVYDIIYNNTFDFDSIPVGIESVSILIVSILLIYNKLTNESPENIFSPEVIISIAFILFFAGTFFLFILSQQNFYKKSFNETFSYIVASFNIIKNTLITIGVIKYYNYNFFNRNTQNI
jgi:hypothetical protein